MKKKRKRRLKKMRALQSKVQNCTDCKLYKKAKKVFGEGNVCAKVVLIAEGPGQDEDIQSRPMVGKAGRLLRRMLTAIGVETDKIFIINTVKCRTNSKNRDPLPNELKACKKWLDAQLNILRPDLIIAVGRVAAHALLNTQIGIMKLKGHLKIRGQFRIVPVVHPGYYLRDKPKSAIDDWREELRTAFALADIEPPEGKSWWKYLRT